MPSAMPIESRRPNLEGSATRWSGLAEVGLAMSSEHEHEHEQHGATDGQRERRAPPQEAAREIADAERDRPDDERVVVLSARVVDRIARGGDRGDQRARRPERDVATE